jgi:hypothetical protein
MEGCSLCHLKDYADRIAIAPQSPQYWPDLIGPVERMWFGVFLFRVRFGISGVVNPIELKQTFVSFGH